MQEWARASIPELVLKKSAALFVVFSMVLVVSPVSAQDAPPDPGTEGSEQPAEVDPPTTVDPNLPVPENEDPLAGEGEGDVDPSGDVAVPRSGRYANQPAFTPPQVQWSLVRAAEKRLTEAEAEHAEQVDRIRSLRLREKALRHKIQELGEESRETIAALEEAEDRLRARALNAFTSADTSTASVSIVNHDDLLEARSQQFLVETAFKVDQATIDEIGRLKAQLDTDSLLAFDRLSRVVDTVVRMERLVVELAAGVDDAAMEVEVFKQGSEFYVSDAVFPIDGPYDVPLIDSWGYPRGTGTPNEHWHEGIDIFAPEGTPIVASERGVATRVGYAELGGLRVWVEGDTGNKWYYSHMSAIEADLEAGDIVEIGDVLGYTGTSGNAAGTPAHLHLQVHPAGKRPTNPYPILKVISDRDQARAAEEAEDLLDLANSRPVGPTGFGAPTGFGGFIN